MVESIPGFTGFLPSPVLSPPEPPAGSTIPSKVLAKTLVPRRPNIFWPCFTIGAIVLVNPPLSDFSILPSARLFFCFDASVFNLLLSPFSIAILFAKSNANALPISLRVSFISVKSDSGLLDLPSRDANLPPKSDLPVDTIFFSNVIYLELFATISARDPPPIEKVFLLILVFLRVEPIKFLLIATLLLL